MTPAVSTRATTFETSPDRVPAKAAWAPMTSLFSRLTSAPVRVLVKKATGIFCTWSKTAVRRSKMMPSPSREENQRTISEKIALKTATTAIIPASPSTVAASLWATIASTTRPARTGVTTVRTAAHTEKKTNTSSCFL